MTENKHTFAGVMDRDNTEALNPTSSHRPLGVRDDRSSPRHHQQPPNHQPSEDTMTNNTKTREAHDAYIANRREAGRVIDIETCEIACWYTQLL